MKNTESDRDGVTSRRVSHRVIQLNAPDPSSSPPLTRVPSRDRDRRTASRMAVRKCLRINRKSVFREHFPIERNVMGRDAGD